MGGTYDKENLVLLTGREHFLIHWLLAEIYDTDGLWYAFNKMCLISPTNLGRIVPSSRIIEYVKLKTLRYKKRKRSEKELDQLRNGFRGHKHSEVSKQKTSISCKAMWTDEMRKQQSLRSKASWKSGACTGKHNLGRKHSEETKKKISDKHKGKTMSLTARENMSKAKKGIKPEKAIMIASLKRKSPVYQYDINGVFIKEWDCITEASQNLHIPSSAISRCALGQYKKTHNFIFKYAENKFR